jgi:PST family polysaccharide transporter
VRGTTELGYYGVAYRVAELPYLSIAEPVTRSAATVTVQQRREGVVAADERFVGSLERSAAICWFASAVMVCAAGPLVSFVFGARWQDAAPMLAVLGVWELFRVLNVWLGWVFALADRQRLAGVVAAAWFPAFLAGVIVGAHLGGGVGAAVAVTAQLVAHTLTLTALATRQAPATMRAVSRALAPLLTAWAAAVAGGLLVAPVAAGAPAVVQLVVRVTAALWAYVGVLLLTTSTRRRLVVALRGS